jgi:hypothetical protein
MCYVITDFGLARGKAEINLLYSCNVTPFLFKNIRPMLDATYYIKISVGCFHLKFKSVILSKKKKMNIYIYIC